MKDHIAYGIGEIDEGWNTQMLALAKESPIVSGGLELVIDRHPDIYFIARIKARKIRSAGFFLKDELVGFVFLIHRPLWVNGSLEEVVYLSNLLVHPASRGKVPLFRISDFFLSDPDMKEQVGFTLIMHGNAAVSRLLNRFHPRFPNVPKFREIGQWQVDNILLLPRFHSKSKIRVRQAHMGDLDRIVEQLHEEYSYRLFGPEVSHDTIMHYINDLPGFGIENFYLAEMNDQVVGVCCAWDMSLVKKNRIMVYGNRLTFLRTLIRLLGWILNFPGLPAPGEAFREVTITDYASRERDPGILKAMLEQVYRQYRQHRYHLMILGHAAGDPIGRAVRSFITRKIVSDIYIFSKSREKVDQFSVTAHPFIDMMLL
jgi:hypothetical protein